MRQASADTELAWRMADLARYGVRVRFLTSLELRQHETMQVHYRALSVADAEALVIARADKAVVLTGDGSLRKAALDAGVQVRGVLGELKRLVAAAALVQDDQQGTRRRVALRGYDPSDGEALLATA